MRLIVHKMSASIVFTNNASSNHLYLHIYEILGVKIAVGLSGNNNDDHG